MQFKTHKNGDVLLCEGSLDMGTVAELRSVLLSSLDPSVEIALDLSSIHECDVSGLQMLYAAGKWAGSQRKRFSIVAVSPSVESTSAAIGLSLEPFRKRSLELV